MHRVDRAVVIPAILKGMLQISERRPPVVGNQTNARSGIIVDRDQLDKPAHTVLQNVRGELGGNNGELTAGSRIETQRSCEALRHSLDMQNIYEVANDVVEH